ncbi:MAG: serine/threonine-protein kinase [Bryobacteraceae bacterium]
MLLDRDCGGDSRLRNEVESLLAHADADRLLEATFEIAAAGIVASDPVVGARVGAYRIVSELGHGGMGTVYLAVRDDDVYRKQVAVKLIRRGLDTVDMAERFRHERQILANLDHPYIARLLDGGSTAHGAPFFVMEYVEGKPVDEYCREQGSTLEERCRLLLRVCEGVAYAHQNLVVHRDLKPGNILVTAGGNPKLLDFGVAKLLDGESEPGLTRVAPRPATPEYASPEHLRGWTTSTATDVYSLGAVLYELVTGARIRKPPGKERAAWERMMEAEVPPPRSIDPRLPLDLENILLMALRKEPERRYRSVEQFAADIRNFLEKRPVMARQDSLGYRTGRYMQRNAMPLAAAAIVAISLVAGTAVAIGQARRAEAALQVAEAQREATERERRRAEQNLREADRAHAAAEVQRHLADSEAKNARAQEQRANRRLRQMVSLANRSLFEVHGAIEHLPGSTPARRDLVKTTLAFLENLARDSNSDDQLSLALAAAYLRVGDIQGFPNAPSYGDTGDALDSYARAEHCLRPLLGHPSREVLEVWIDVQYARATTLVNNGRQKEAGQILTAALPLADRLQRLHREDTRRAKLLQGLVNALQFIDPQAALETGRRAIAERQRQLSRHPSDAVVGLSLAAAHSMVAMLLKRRDDFPAALRHLRESERLRSTMGVTGRNATRQRGLMLTYGQIAALLEDPDNSARDIGEARTYYEKAAAIAGELSRADPQNRLAQYDLAQARMRLGSGATASPDPEECSRLMDSARRTLEALAAAEPKSVRYQRALVMAYRAMGESLAAEGKLEEAVDQRRKAEAAADAVLAAAPRDAATVRLAIANEQAIATLLAQLGDRSALAYAAKALARAQQHAFPDLPATRNTVANAYLALAEVERQLESWGSARSAARLAASEWKDMLKRGGNEEWNRGLRRATELIAECDRRAR